MSGEGARYELERDLDLDRRSGAPGICVGGGVMSDEGKDGGEMNLRLSECGDRLPARSLNSGDADNVAR